MQVNYRIITWALCLLTLHNLQAQRSICSGESVEFRLAANYWGEPRAEFSRDSIQWQPFPVVLNQAFVIKPQMTGFYRIRMVDTDCNASYVSQVERIHVLHTAPPKMNSVFEDGKVPARIDPFCWLTSEDSLSNGKFYLNGTLLAGDALQLIVANPGDNFSIWATATNSLGCQVRSDTLHLEAIKDEFTNNGSLALSTPLALTAAKVGSSIDSTWVLGNNGFEIDLRLTYGSDIVFAYNPGVSVDSQLIAMQLVFDGAEPLVLSEQSSALTLVMGLPDILPYSRAYNQQVRDFILQDSRFALLRGMFENDLAQHRFINIESADKWVLIDSLRQELIGTLIPLLTQSCNSPVKPGLVNGSLADNALNFEHCGINLAYAAGVYRNGQPASNQVLLFKGNVDSELVQKFYNYIRNWLLSVPGFQPAVFQQYGIIRADNTLRTSDLNFSDTFAELEVKLSNGYGQKGLLNGGWKREDDIAEEYNRLNWLSSLYSGLSVIPGILESLFGECSAEVLQNVKDGYTALRGSNKRTEAEVLEEVNEFGESIVSTAVECSDSPLLKKIAGVFEELGKWVGYGSIAKTEYQRRTAQNWLTYRYTKLGDQWAGRLELSGNNEEEFVGIPGSFTAIRGSVINDDPVLRIDERALNIYNREGQELHVSDPEPLDANRLNGFSLQVKTRETAALEYNNQVFSATSGVVNIAQVLNSPLPLKWRLSLATNTPRQAELALKLNYKNIPLPPSVAGYAEEGVLFRAAIEEPKLEITGGNDQGAKASEFLPQSCSVVLETISGVKISRHKFIRFSVISGGGSIRKSDLYGGGSLSTQVDFDQTLLGQASVEWKLGPSGEQRMRAQVITPNGNVLKEQVFKATIGCQGGITFVTDIEGREYPVVQIGNQCWTKTDLRTYKYADGSNIPNIGHGYEWQRSWVFTQSGARSTNPEVGGVLYNWLAVADSRKLCPTGWHVPTDAEWTVLIDFLGGDSIAGNKMKNINSWDNYPGHENGTNESGFSGFPRGSRVDYVTIGAIGGIGTSGYWWSSTESSETNAWFRFLYFGNSSAASYNGGKKNGFSVRCLRD
jgi:uncharacterized protein (TIGR02145 family)